MNASGDKNSVKTFLSRKSDPLNVAADRRKCRSYKETAKALNLSLKPCVGIATMESGTYLLHAEHLGMPHCIALRVEDHSDTYTLIDGDILMTIGSAAFYACAGDAVDRSSLVVFTLCDVDHVHKPETDSIFVDTSMLLDLQAGVKRSHSSVEKTVPLALAVDSDDDEASENLGAHSQDDESVVHVGDEILELLRLEVSKSIERMKEKLPPKCNNAHRCELCPFRCFSGKHPEHLLTHMIKHHTQRNQYCCSGTKQIKVIIALYDSDQFARSTSSTYIRRSADIIRNSVRPPLNSAHNEVDRHIRLVFTVDGPVYMNVDSLTNLVAVRRTGNLHYTHEFAEILFREALLNNAKMKTMWNRLQVRAYERGSELGSLYPQHVQYWWPMLEDVFSSAAVTAIKERLITEAVEHTEFLYISIDATMKCCMPLLGQASSRASKDTRAQAAFDDISSKRRVLTVRGRTSAVPTMVPIADESSNAVAVALENNISKEARNQVQHVGCDNPSKALWIQLKRVCPNIETLCLDATHLPIVYEYAHWHKRTPGSRYLRLIMCKFARRDTSIDKKAWGPVFHGDSPTPLNREEENMRSILLNMSMSMPRAKAIQSNMSADKPFFTRIDFIEALASLVKLFNDEVQRKVTGSNKSLYTILWCATSPERMEWLFNNIRCRYMLPLSVLKLLSSGSTSNEALHAEINGWFRQTQQLHQSTLKLKLDILTLGKLVQHNSAMYRPTSRHMTAGLVMARSLAVDVWNKKQWKEWCSQLKTAKRVNKAPLPLTLQRKTEALKVKQWILKRPASGKSTSRKPREVSKRTACSLQRVDNLIRGGVKSSVFKK